MLPVGHNRSSVIKFLDNVQQSSIRLRFMVRKDVFQRDDGPAVEVGESAGREWGKGGEGVGCLAWR